MQRRAYNALESGNIETLRGVLHDKPAITETISYYLSNSNDDLSDSLSTAIFLFKGINNNYKNDIAHNIIDRTMLTIIEYINSIFLKYVKLFIEKDINCDKNIILLNSYSEIKNDKYN